MLPRTFPQGQQVLAAGAPDDELVNSCHLTSACLMPTQTSCPSWQGHAHALQTGRAAEWGWGFQSFSRSLTRISATRPPPGATPTQVPPSPSAPPTQCRTQWRPGCSPASAAGGRGLAAGLRLGGTAFALTPSFGAGSGSEAAEQPSPCANEAARVGVEAGLRGPRGRTVPGSRRVPEGLTALRQLSLPSSLLLGRGQVPGYLQLKHF